MRSGLMECDVRGIVVQEFILTGFETHSVLARWVTNVFVRLEISWGRSEGRWR